MSGSVISFNLETILNVCKNLGISKKSIIILGDNSHCIYIKENVGLPLIYIMFKIMPKSKYTNIIEPYVRCEKETKQFENEQQLKNILSRFRKLDKLDKLDKLNNENNENSFDI